MNLNPATLQQALQHHQANRLPQAEESYLQVLSVQPDHPEALHRLGLLAQQMGRVKEAEKWWQKLLHYHPDSAKAWFSLGNLHQTQGQLSAAEAAYQQAIARQPDAAPIYNNQGFILQQQGKLKEAIAHYQKALELQPNCAEAEANLGNALQAQGQLSNERQVHYAKVNLELGQKYRQVGQLQAAIAYYQKAIELQPTQWDAYNRLGRIYQTQNNLTEALAIYRQGLSRLNPRYAEAITAYEASGAAVEAIATPPIPQRKVTVGAYQFPAIPPVTDPDEPRPFWTVVIPVYNRVEYLLECLASVLVQWPGVADMEILVMDNASTTPIFEWVNSLAGGIVRYYRNPQNIGGTANYNAGISLARGQWVHVLHDDDCVLPGFYAKLQRSLATCPDSVGVGCSGFDYINEAGESIDTGEIVSLYGEQQGILQNWLPKIGVCGLVTIPAMVIRRSAHERLGGYSPELAGIDDWEIFKRYASFYDWWYEPGILARYREHTQKMTPENWRTGKLASSIRRAIEVSDTYLPIEQRAEITARARIQNLNYCLSRASIPMSSGNLLGTLQILQEVLKIDSSSQAVTTTHGN
jgi:tetratricopeptide (TPR) repeat protein